MVCGSVKSQTASLIYRDRDLCDVELLVLMPCYRKVFFGSVCVCDSVALWFVEQQPLCHVESGTEPIIDMVQTVGYVKVI